MGLNRGGFRWRSYLDLAHELAEQGREPRDEARLRCSVSRAYYAAFIAARNFLRDHDSDQTLAARKDSLHAHVREQFEFGADPERQQIADYLKRLYQARVRADYHDIFRTTTGEIDFLLDHADEVFELLKQLQLGR